MALQKGMPGARKARWSHYLVFQGKVISKILIVIGESHLVYQNNVISKKKVFNLGEPLFCVPKHCYVLNKSSFYLKGHFVLRRKKVSLNKVNV